MMWYVMGLVWLGQTGLGSAEQTFLQQEQRSFTLPLRAIPLQSSDKLAMVSLLATHHRAAMADPSPTFLESHSSASMYLKNYFNTQFVGSVGIGSPPQYLDVILDTGSANFWINSKLCEEEVCREQASYDHTVSSDFDELGFFVEVTFGTGEVNGEINQDTVELAGIRISGQRFGEITDMDGKVFEDAKFAGILGLAFPELAAFGFQPVFDSIMKSKQLSKNIFTFYYSLNPDEQSQLSMGAIDKSKFEGEITWVDVIEGMEYYWLIEMDDVRLGDIDLGLCPKGCHAAVDTGTTLLAAPTDSASKILFTLNLDENCKEYWALPDLNFVIQGREFPVKARDYILTVDSEGGEDAPGEHSKSFQDCAMAMMPMDIPKP